MIATIGSLVVLALIDSTSFGTLLIPLGLLTAPGRLRIGRLLLFLSVVAGSFRTGRGIAVWGYVATWFL